MTYGKRPPLDEQKSLWESTVAREGVTTVPGNIGGTSFTDAGLALTGVGSFISMLAVIYPGQPRLVDSRDITGFDNPTGEVTVATAFKGGQVPAGVPYKIVTFHFVPAEVAALTALVQALMLDVGDASTAALGSLFGILGDPAVGEDLATRIGYEGLLSIADKLTAARALLLDNLDAAISTRALEDGGRLQNVEGAVGPIEGLTDLHNKLTAARALLLDEITALRMAELDPAGVPADIAAVAAQLVAVLADTAALLVDTAAIIAAIAALNDLAQADILSDATPFAGANVALIKTDTGNLVTRLGTPAAGTVAGDVESIETKVDTIDGIVDSIILDTQIRRVASGVKAINAGVTKYLEIDSGTNGAEILAIIIKGVVGADWTVDVYVPTDDAVAAPAAGDKRDTFSYVNTDTEAGLLGPLGIAYNMFLDFTNDSAGADNIDDVVVVYRSRAALTLSWEA